MAGPGVTRILAKKPSEPPMRVAKEVLRNDVVLGLFQTHTPQTVFRNVVDPRVRDAMSIGECVAMTNCERV